MRGRPPRRPGTSRDGPPGRLGRLGRRGRMSAIPRLTFGLYPGSATGSDSSNLVAGPPDDPNRILAALRALQGDGRPLIVRGYEPFCDWPSDRPVTRRTPEDLAQYAGEGRRLDVVVMFQSA